MSPVISPRAAWTAVACLALMACGEGADMRSGDAGEPDADVPRDAGTTDAGIVDAPRREAYAFSGMRITPVTGQAPGETPSGHDLDGNAETVCGHSDLTTPSGGTGIDNLFWSLWVEYGAFLNRVNAFEFSTLNRLLDDSPTTGGLQMGLIIEADVDASEPDAETVTISPLRGLLLVGADGEVLPYQTVALDPGYPLYPAPLRRDGGVALAEAMRFEIAFATFGFVFDLPVEQGRMRIREHDGGLLLELAFPLSADELRTLATDYGEYLTSFDPQLGIETRPGMDAWIASGGLDLDLDRDGVCDAVSVQFEIALVPVLVFQGEAAATPLSPRARIVHRP